MTETLPELELVTVRLAPCRGVPAIVQGTYGAVGNLELVVPDASGGLWIHWRNLDPEDVRPGARAGGWSAGLRIAEDRRFDACATLETAPDRCLVVVASSEGELYAATWTAGAGFGAMLPAGFSGDVVGVRQDSASKELVVTVITDASAVSELRCRTGSGRWSEAARPWPLGSLEGVPIVSASMFPSPAGGPGIVVVTAQGELWQAGSAVGARRLSSGLGDAVVALDGPGGSLEVVAIDRDGGLRLWSDRGDVTFARSLGRVDALAACRVDRGQRGIAVVARVGDRLWWCPAPGGPERDEPHVIQTEAWVAADAGPINGGAR